MNAKWLGLALAVAAAGVLPGCQWDHTEAAIDRYVAGKLAMERDDFEIALAELRRAVWFDPELSLAHTAMGDVHRKQGNYGLAANAYEHACETNPYSFLPHYNLGVTYQYLADAPSGGRSAGDYVQLAIRIYLRAVTIKPRNFDTNLNLSACYYQQGKYDLSEQYCKEAVNVRPDNPYAHSNLGIIYDAQNRPYDSIRAYKDSLELNVHQPELLLNLGSTYLRLGRVKEALRAFELAAREDPDSASPWVQIGTCYFHLKQWDKALPAYQKAVELDNRCAEAYRGIGVACMTQFLLDRGKTELRDKALAAWQRSLELQSNQPDLIRLVRKYTPEVTGPEL